MTTQHIHNPTSACTCSVFHFGRGENINYCKLHAAAPEILVALKEAREMLQTASQYFPKSIKNRDRFSLLNVLANSIEPAINKAEGKA